MKTLFQISKWFHKYIGLLVLVYLLIEGVTGILLNHPDLIEPLSVSRRWVPDSYQIENWNRGAIRSISYAPSNPDLAFAWGTQGVWKTTDGGRTFEVMADGYPVSAQGRRTNTLLLDEESNRLFAGTNGGLFVCDPYEGQWQDFSLGKHDEPVRQVLRIRDQLVVFTASHAFSGKDNGELEFQEVNLLRMETNPEISLIMLFFTLHGGKIWGLPGRLLFDLAGLLLIFLSISGFYMWYFPWRRKALKKQNTFVTKTWSKTAFQFFTRYHRKLGIWIAAILLIIGVTGMFMRPPMVMLLIGKNVPKSAFPGFWPENPWQDKIGKAIYCLHDDTIIIEADGFWRGPADFSRPFEAADVPVSTFPMGATITMSHEDGSCTIGSFAGISRWNPATSEVTDLIAEEPYNRKSHSFFKFMVSGYFETPQGEAFVVGHNKGLQGIAGAGARERFIMPQALVERYRMPLWSFLFELHNGRIIRDFIGLFYILIPLLGGFSLVLLTLSGIYDWCYRKNLCNSSRKQSAKTSQTSTAEGNEKPC